MFFNRDPKNLIRISINGTISHFDTYMVEFLFLRSLLKPLSLIVRGATLLAPHRL
jgi:hypothetical protein